MTAIIMPNPMPTKHQDLLNLFADVGATINAARSPDQPRATRAEIASIVPSVVNMAVFLAALNYQVENGGFKQWYGNDYHREGVVILPMLAAAADIGIEGAAKMHEIVESAMNEIREHDLSGSSSFSFTALDDDGEDVERGLCDSQDIAFYAEEGRLALFQAMLDRFDEIEQHRTVMFFGRAFSKAA